MNIRSCAYLIAIAQAGTLSRAAKALGVSQPTLSAFVGNTERQLGQPLFDRSGKTMTLTPAGEVYLAACRRIAEVKSRTYHSIAALSNQCSERFTVGATPHRGSTVFSRAYAPFYRRYPNVRIDLKEGYMGFLRRCVSGGEVDIALGTVTEEDMRDYSFVSHNREELLLCVPDFHPLAALSTPEATAPVSIDILRFHDTPFVMWGDQTTNHQRIQAFFQQRGFSPTVVYQSNNMPLIDTMIASGAGVGFLPASQCHPGQGRVYFSMEPPLYSFVGVFYHRGLLLTEAQRYFIYLIMRAQLADPSTEMPYLNGAAQAIFDEFKEDDHGYPSA